MNPIDMDSAILNARFKNGGEVVNGADSLRLPPEPPVRQEDVFMRLAVLVWIGVVIGVALCAWLLVTAWPVMAYALTTF